MRVGSLDELPTLFLFMRTESISVAIDGIYYFVFTLNT